MCEREVVRPQRGRLPGAAGVAVIAALAKDAGVQFRLCVASGTGGRCVSKLSGFVAFQAGKVGMLAGQREGYFVHETMQAVFAIMTGQAVLSVGIQMLLHENFVVLTVAGDAGRQVLGQVRLAWILGVAAFAGHGLPGIIFEVDSQGKARQTMIKGFARQGDVVPVKGVVAGLAVICE